MTARPAAANPAAALSARAAAVEKDPQAVSMRIHETFSFSARVAPADQRVDRAEVVDRDQQLGEPHRTVA